MVGAAAEEGRDSRRGVFQCHLAADDVPGVIVVVGEIARLVLEVVVQWLVHNVLRRAELSGVPFTPA